MQNTLVFVGALVGFMVAGAGTHVLGIAGGALLGFLVSRVTALSKELDQLKRRLDQGHVSAGEAARPLPARPVESAAPVQTRSRVAGTARPDLQDKSLDQGPDEAKERPQQTPPASTSKAWGSPGPVREWGAPVLTTRLLRLARNWLSTGNVPVKLGVIVSFFGVAFLLKYAVERQVLVVPIELRLLAVAAVAVVLLAFGWRFRDKNRVYGLSLQGGGIGVLYLTLFAAFKLYAVLPAAFVFSLLIALTVAAGVLAVLQNAMALAVLASVGGFLAPVLISTGSGNHVGLFSYYLVLNAAILGIAWYRSWRLLNIIGFAFTFAVAGLWGYENYKPELFASTEPFLVVFFVFYQVIAILFAFRQPPRLRGLVDGTLVFGTPVLAFGMQAAIVGRFEYGLAISAVAVALFYVGVATWLNRRYGAQMRLLTESFVALAVAFATIAIPLALDPRWTAAAWALEGAALVWVGVRQQGLLARLSGSGLLIASGLAFIDSGWAGGGIPILNGDVLGGMLVSLASLFSSHYLSADPHKKSWQTWVSVGLLVWGLVWWLGTGAMEIETRVGSGHEIGVVVLFASASAAALAWTAAHLKWLAARRATLAYLPLLLPVAGLFLLDKHHFLTGLGWLAWPVAMAGHFWILKLYDDGRTWWEGAWHYAGMLFAVAILGQELSWRIERAGYGDVWVVSGALLIIALAPLAIIRLRGQLAWPLQRYWGAYLGAALTMIAAQLLLLVVGGIDHPADPAPLPYIPILNPLDLLTIGGLIIALVSLIAARETHPWMRQQRFVQFAMGLGVAAFVLTTISVVRAVYHFGEMDWSSRSLMQSVSVQSALSIYWGALAFGAMIFGARRGKRMVWIGGTGLMAIVVLKLFLIDLGNTATVARIVSFLGVGLLLLVVGYFAPAPPKDGPANASGVSDE
ncbi:MAG: DUF2339 domain-containing protein [Gammaproteobacteria bacterium]